MFWKPALLEAFHREHSIASNVALAGTPLARRQTQARSCMSLRLDQTTRHELMQDACHQRLVWERLPLRLGLATLPGLATRFLC